MSNTAHEDTIEIRLSVRRNGAWKDIHKVVDSHRVLDEARKLAKRVGAREMRVGGANLPGERSSAPPRWVWHVAGLHDDCRPGGSAANYWGL